MGTVDEEIMKLSHQPKDTDNPNVTIAKAQAKADHWRRRAENLGAVLFDTLYPDYNTDEKEFKANYVYFKEEMGKVIHQRDKLKTTVKSQATEIARLRELLKDVLKEPNGE